MKKIILLLMLMFGLSSCFSSKTPKELLGEYVDINSDTRLTVKGDKLIISYGDYSSTYKYTYKDSVLTSKDGGFGHYSEIRIENGHLRCEELILDDEGHTYIFVREEEKDEALTIKDESVEMPKQIESDVIEELSLHFKKDSRDVYKLGDWPDMNYMFEIKKEDDGYYAEYHEYGPSYVGRTYNDKVSEEFVEGLQKVIREANVIENNGYFFKNDVMGKSYSLIVRYESGEEVKVKASGDAADVCPFDLKMIMEYVSELLN